MDKPLTFQYKGSRGAWYVYHPAKHGPPAMDGQWERALKDFWGTVDDLMAVGELFNGEQTLHEKVAPEAWKRDIQSLVRSLEKDGKNVYDLEALMEMIFDREKKAERRDVDTHAEIKRLGELIRFEDSGLVSPIGIDPKSLIKIGYTGR